MSRWIIHISMTSTWVFALMVAALGDRPVEVLTASIFIVLTPFIYIAMIEEANRD